MNAKEFLTILNHYSTSSNSLPMNVVGSLGRHSTLRNGVGPGWAIFCYNTGGSLGCVFGGTPPPNVVYKEDIKFLAFTSGCIET